MAKTFGDRWQIATDGSLGQGGQGEVFRVIDLLEQHIGEYALKRVRNPARFERFKTEVVAVTRLSHPNIVKLIDHSALDDVVQPEKHYLVMPIAKGGDLSNPDRVSLYKGTLDAPLQIAGQIAAGLEAAHASGIVHRDIKPANILFSGNGHEVWIADFGICLIREQERHTPADEVVGPRVFMAPELEDGGKLEVTPAADIYSLGKLIYFMISGGVMIPRERLNESPYVDVFGKGGRHTQLRLLLSRMICSLPGRIADVREVARELKRIEEWDQNVPTIPISARALQQLDEIQQNAVRVTEIKTSNLAARQQENQTSAIVLEGVTAWLRVELEKVAAVISNSALMAKVQDASIPTQTGQMIIQTTNNGGYVTREGVALALADTSDNFSRQNLLQLLVCEERKSFVTVHVGGAPKEVEQPTRDIQFALIPMYRQIVGNQPPKASARLGYLTKPALIGQLRGQLTTPNQGNRARGRSSIGVQHFRLSALTKSFHPDASQTTRFLASEWPSCVDQLRAQVTEAIDVFVDLVRKGGITIGQ